MSENTKKLIKQYFNSLVDQFITDPAHKDITIVFKDYLGSSLNGDTLGNTHWERTGGREHWQTLNGVEVPGSRWQEPYKYTYTITFLNNYKDEERWRGTVAHEFAHLYLFSKGDGDHKHDDNFYSKMDYFEDWLDKKWNLSPRKDKGGDWNQHVDYDKRKQRENQYPNQPRNNDNNYYSRNDRYERYEDSPEGKKSKEFGHLSKLVLTGHCNTLTELESNYQTVKSSKRQFCTSCLNHNEKHQLNCAKKCSKCSHSHLSSDSSRCHNQNCENSCWDPKWKEEDKRKDQEQDEYNRLVDLMKNAKDLSELERAYQTVKNSSLYDSNKRTWEKFNNTSKVPEDNKKELDLWYNDFKNRFSSSEPEEPKDYYPTNKDKPNELWILFAVIGGTIIGIWLIFKLFSRLFSVRKRKKFKK